MESVTSEEVSASREDSHPCEGTNEAMKTLFIRMETAEERLEFEAWLVDLWN
jgi:hypothetical protein